MTNMLNPTENGTWTSTSGGAQLTRYHFHLDTGSVETVSFPNLLNEENSRYINEFDFPMINEEYRGKEVNHF